MLLGLSHVGLTVNELDTSLKYYHQTLGFKVLSDAERKGEWVEKITGIPGFHTRTVYLSVDPYRHLEVFEFFNPKPVLAHKGSDLQVGILYCAFMGKVQVTKSLGENVREKKDSAKLIENMTEEPYRPRGIVTLQDPDGLFLRVIKPTDPTNKNEKELIKEILYPSVIVKDIDDSTIFYRDVLGLEIKSWGGPPLRLNNFGENSPGKSIRWVLFKDRRGICLKLVQPLNFKILNPAPWKMQRIGFTHIAFGVQDLENYYNELLKRKVRFKSPPQIVTAGPHQGGKAVYLTTPEGMTLEFIESPLIQAERAKLKKLL